ncbi:haloacid dehalogenase, type II [Talaromyces stipitatus ATCC 10500]|uniref:Haloacid dehalogenase, type II n=1 Tax=Talaromyces stipitatus (strain ATCC 10500 / CBS 375.48 / QM 6759 / NRRL 1006) TaxID=441959 RepID=B8LUM7_TALSN|nr:haloacid dehalogenase, type II [Talaromyces stipitatus ATCC 10500]EED23884.1 haloacid dehalogenase, type II [Talaromyces stipitatus ATCC 10500]
MAQSGSLIAFDLYGTLLSTESISKRLSEILGSQETGTQVAASWRKYQLEYSWRLTCMESYDDFYNITRNALRHALSEAAVRLEEDQIDQLMDEYDHLSTFPDVTPALQNLTKRPDIKTVIFSNGTKQMVSNSVFRSQDLSPHASLFTDLVTVEDVKAYKPAPAVYEHLAVSTGTQMGDIWLISANPFDIVGAGDYGLKTAWIDRNGRGWEDAAVPRLRPRIIGKSLDEVIKAILDDLSK